MCFLLFLTGLFSDPVNQKVAYLVVYVSSMLLCCTCIFQFIENNCDERVNELSFFDCFWYIVVTMTTVGYGDVFPICSEGKSCVIIMMIFLLFMVPGSVQAVRVRRLGLGG